MASGEETRSLQVILNALKETVAPAPFRLLMKVLKHAVVTQIYSRGVGIGHLQLNEFNFRAVDCQTSQCRELLTLLGFEPCIMEQGISHEMVLHDVSRNMPFLEAFRDLAMEELARTTCPNVEDLKDISSVPLLIAHLACNYHLRFQHFLLITHEDMMPILQEDILAASDCVEFLASRLGVMLPGSDCRSSWNNLKQSAHKYQSMPVFRAQLDDMFVENARKLAADLAMRFHWTVVEVFVHVFAFQRIAGIVGSGVIPQGDNLANYLESSEVIASVCPSDQFLSSVATCKGLLLKSFDCTLTPVEIYKLAQELIWQTRNFIYHFQPDSLSYSEYLPTTGHVPELGTGLLSETESHELLSGIESQEIADEDALVTAQSVVDCSTVPESVSSIQATMIALRQSVALCPWRLFLKFLHRVVTTHVNASHGTVASVNPYEMNFCAVYFDNELGPRLVHQIGYRSLGENRVTRFELAMFNVSQHREQLAAFQQLAEEELASTSCPGIEQLQQIDSIPLWVAHLAYNYHVRVGLLVMTTSVRTLELVIEDVHSGLECCEYLFSKLNIMVSGGSYRQQWHEAKQAIISYMDKRVPSFMEELKGRLSEVTSQVAMELSRTLSLDLVAVFNYMYAVQLAAGICVGGEMLATGNISRYLDSFDDMPGACMSERYMESVEKIRSIMLRSFDVTLPRVDVLKIGEIAIWQSRNFIYHFQSQVVAGSQPNPLIQEGLAVGRPSVINDDEMSSGDEEEKVDLSEKVVLEKRLENDCNFTEKCLQSDSQLVDDCSSQAATALSVETIKLSLHATSSRDDIAKLQASICSLVSDTLSQQKVLEGELEDLRSAVLHSSELPSIICQTLEEALKEKTSDYDVTTERLSELDKLLAHSQRLLHETCVSLQHLGCDVSKMLKDTLWDKRASLDIVSMICGVIHLLSKEEIGRIGWVLGASPDESALDLIMLLNKTVVGAGNTPK